MKDEIKTYFQQEIDQVVIPPMPNRLKKSERREKALEMIKLGSCIAATFLILLSPLNRTSPIREIEITEKTENIIKEELTAGLLGGMKYFSEKRSKYE